MRLRRIILIVTNFALLAAFWPLLNELQFIPTFDHVPYKRSPISPPVSSPSPQQPDLDRPLFRPKPSSLELDQSSPVASYKPNIRLLGIVLTTERQVAVIEIDGSIFRVEEGGDVNGWQVTKIERRKIRLENFEQHMDVFLDPPDDAR